MTYFWKEKDNRESLWAKYQTVVEKAVINLSFSNATSEFHWIELYNVSLKQASGFKESKQAKEKNTRKVTRAHFFCTLEGPEVQTSTWTN